MLTEITFYLYRGNHCSQTLQVSPSLYKLLLQQFVDKAVPIWTVAADTVINPADMLCLADTHNEACPLVHHVAVCDDGVLDIMQQWRVNQSSSEVVYVCKQMNEVYVTATHRSNRFYNEVQHTTHGLYRQWSLQQRFLQESCKSIWKQAHLRELDQQEHDSTCYRVQLHIVGVAVKGDGRIHCSVVLTTDTNSNPCPKKRVLLD